MAIKIKQFDWYRTIYKNTNAQNEMSVVLKHKEKQIAIVIKRLTEISELHRYRNLII